MRNFQYLVKSRLLVLATAASILGASAGSYLLATPAPLVAPSSGCMEASQLLSCLNSAVINLLRGSGQTSPLSVGSWGTISGATPQTLNTQGGVVSFTGVTAAGNANATAQVLNNSLVTASSACLVTAIGGTYAAGSGLAVKDAVPAAGTLTITLTNATATTTGSSTVNLAFWCAN